MTLSFSKENIEKRLFVEKIWIGLQNNGLCRIKSGKFINEYKRTYFRKFGKRFDNRLHGTPKMNKSQLNAKIHTIRADKSNRWKVGNKIHFVMNNRTTQRFQFAPIMEVKAIQKFRVTWDEGIVHVFIDEILFYTNIGYHSSFAKFHKQMQKFAENDGFLDIKSFLNYFSEDFEGKIIHWTEFKY